jgi:hypothetical protein
MVLFQKCVRRGHNFERGPPKDHFSKVWFEIGSVVSEEKNFFKFHPPFFLICIIGQNRQSISIMMSFLTYITGFFMNFELLPILTDYAN